MKTTMIYIMAICASLIGVAIAGIVSTTSFPVASFLFTTTVALALIHHTAKQDKGTDGYMIDADLPPPPQYPNPEPAVPAVPAPAPAPVAPAPQPPAPEPVQAPPPAPAPAEATEEEITKAIKDYIDLNKDYASMPEITTALITQGANAEQIKKALDSIPKPKEPKVKKK